MKITEYNMDKAKFVEDHYESVWGWAKSFFKPKPTDFIPPTTTLAIQIEEAEHNFQYIKEVNKVQTSLPNTTKEDKDKIIEEIIKNIQMTKRNAEDTNKILEEQYDFIDNQIYSKVETKFKDK
mmetsp:Transcript_3475/g.2942  ORF Transcript_3475/g.2942 Transcript_3475/m.2942 type:complete len:123 (+) Transcript_3475:174-542(+)